MHTVPNIIMIFRLQTKPVPNIIKYSAYAHGPKQNHNIPPMHTVPNKIRYSAHAHCPKQNHDIPLKLRACHGQSRWNGICLVSGPDIRRRKKARYVSCFRSSRGRLDFNAEIQIIFGTVCSRYQGNVKSRKDKRSRKHAQKKGGCYIVTVGQCYLFVFSTFK